MIFVFSLSWVQLEPSLLVALELVDALVSGSLVLLGLLGSWMHFSCGRTPTEEDGLHDPGNSNFIP